MDLVYHMNTRSIDAIIERDEVSSSVLDGDHRTDDGAYINHAHEANAIYQTCVMRWHPQRFDQHVVYVCPYGVLSFSLSNHVYASVRAICFVVLLYYI